ncbi:MAG: penicillin-binding protein activator LpoB, partial [Verrucomicrobia bacterium]|nr:penicillin-binding protein activator LpoB [Verrucomicrobiota bacterium]
MNRSLTLSFALPLGFSALLLGCSSGGVQNPKGIPVTQMNADE